MSLILHMRPREYSGPHGRKCAGQYATRVAHSPACARETSMVPWGMVRAPRANVARNVRRGSKKYPTRAHMVRAFLTQYGKVYIMRRIVIVVLACVAAYMVRNVGPKASMALMGAHVSIPLLATALVVAGLWVCAGMRK